MKKMILWMLFLPVILFGQNQPAKSVFTIQVGTFVNPKVADFNLINQLGFMYAEPYGKNFYKVYLLPMKEPG
jgi:hypothetical protein